MASICSVHSHSTDNLFVECNIHRIGTSYIGSMLFRIRKQFRGAHRRNILPSRTLRINWRNRNRSEAMGWMVDTIELTRRKALRFREIRNWTSQLSDTKSFKHGCELLGSKVWTGRDRWNYQTAAKSLNSSLVRMDFNHSTQTNNSVIVKPRSYGDTR